MEAVLCLVTLAVCIINVSAISLVKHSEAQGCTVNGVEYGSLHTMCLPDEPGNVPNPPDADLQQAIVDKHNQYRSGVDPTGSNMMKMYWDDKIAEVAQKFAQACRGGHDEDRSVVGYGISIGQNMAGYSDLLAAVDGWYSEVKDFTYGGNNVFDDVGHYTAVVWHKSVAVGCGEAYCPNRNGNLQYCNYAFSQLTSSFNTPYATDAAGCTNTCGSNCKDNLCDCGNKICFNGGLLDLASCSCTCPSNFQGDQCQTLVCPDNEDQCSGWGDATKRNCGYALTANDCVFSCGLCDPPCDGKKCENGGKLDASTCTCACLALYSGDTCATLNCPTNENNCANWGTPTPCSWGPAVNDCPFTCGICEPPCDGRKCENGGTLDPDACTCACMSLYSGDTCATLTCPSNEDNCARWGTPAPCSWGPAANDCPFTCGLC